MTEPKDLLRVVKQLRRSNRFWKGLALAACALVIFVALFGVMRTEAERMRAEAALRRAEAEFANAQAAIASSQRAANPGQPK